jgi:hypothetical protein
MTLNNKISSKFKLNNIDISNSVMDCTIVESIDSIYTYGNVLLSISNKNFILSKAFTPMLLTVEMIDNTNTQEYKFFITGISTNNESNKMDKRNGIVNLRFIDSNSFKLFSNNKCLYLEDGSTGSLISHILDDNKCPYKIVKSGESHNEYLTPSNKTHGESIRELLDDDDSVVGYMTLDMFVVNNIYEMFNDNGIKASLVLDMDNNDYQTKFGSMFDYFKFYDNGMFGYKRAIWDSGKKDFSYIEFLSNNEMAIESPPIFKRSVTRTSFLNRDLLTTVDVGSSNNKLMKSVDIQKNGLVELRFIIKLVHRFDSNRIWSNEMTLFKL